MNRSPHIKGNRFYNHDHESIIERLRGVVSVTLRVAHKRIPFIKNYRTYLDEAGEPSKWVMPGVLPIRAQDPHITWLGHSTFFIQIGSVNIVTDPVFFDIERYFSRVLPFPFATDSLPPIDVILISHNHKDHVDVKTLKLLKKDNPLVLVPQGDKSLFNKMGFERVYEHQWWQERVITMDVPNPSDSLLSCTFLPSYHWSGRSLFDINKSLWGSWMIQSNGFNIYFGGDTAYAGHFKQIREHFKHTTVALLPIGPEEPRMLMQDAHIGVEEALMAYEELNATYFIPMHWGTFRFGTDHFNLPIKKLKDLWRPQDNRSLLLLKCGEVKKF